MGTNTGLGIGIGIPFKNFSSGGRQPLPPDLKASLKGVWIAYGKSNNDADRSIVKNLVDPDNPFVISNAAFKLNSGYGKYEEDFTDWRIYPNIKVTDSVITTDGNFKSSWFIYKYSNESKINEMNIKVSGIPKEGKILYFYISDETANSPIKYTIPKDGIYHLPESKINNNRASVGFTVKSSYDWNNIRIEQIPSFEGAFVTDGIDDLITSTKTVQEMLGGSNEITVVSMIHQIGLISSQSYARNNYFIQGNDFLTNTISTIGKIGIYGYKGNLSNIAIVNDILGDKKDYSVDKANPANIDSVFSVNGTHSSAQLSQIAWYWTIIANKVLTTDQINQVIAYYNLDKYVKPDIYYNVKKQGLTNDTPDEDWYLKDFSGNGRDMTLYNYARTPESGINEEGGLQSDGVVDYGQFVGDLGLKDYTVVIDRAYNNLINNQVPLISSNIVEDQTPFIVEHWNTGSNAISFSYGASRTTDIPLDINKKIVYQSTYSYMGYVIPKGNAISTGNGITLGKFGNGVQYSAICLWSLMLFPYSMSEFLIERQLKKHKLGTLYPDMVEFRPVIKSNASYDNIVFYYKNKKVENGTYLTVGSSIGMHICLSSNSVNEIKSITINGIPATFKFHDANNNIYQYDFNLTSKSPQKINITIDEYIRFEDIVQPYPSLFTLIDYDTEEVYSWGSKLKVGARFKGNVVNLLPNMYEWQGNVLYNGEVLDWGINPGVVAKEMVFSWNMPFKYLIDNNEPKCILSPRLLRIPNSSYKILGYIPDISGHGNNGVIHNSAYAEGSGVNEDGSYQLDGVDDFVTIPTIAGKQVLIKLNWQNKAIGNLIYDQRGNSSTTSFAIMSISINDTTNNKIAYQTKNANGITYIDGIRNEYIESYRLENIIHNITITNPDVSNKTVALGASNRTTADYFAKYALYDFMLFDNISTDDKIKELNEYVGIEAKVELPPYYWDAYGKTNLDGDKATIQQRGVAVGDYDLTNYNHAYEGMSGYNGYPVVFGANKTWEQMPTGTFTWNIDDNKLHITKALIAGNGLLFSYVKLNGSLLNVKEIPSFKIKVSGLEGKSKLWYRYLKTEDAISETTVVLENGTHELPKSYIPSDSLHDGVWIGFTVSPISEGVKEFDCDITIEVLPEYENGLVYDAITDYSKNANIPALDDFTAIIKREWLKKQGCPLIKGSKVYEGGNGNALLLEWDKAYNFVFYKRTDIMEGELPDNISFITPTNYNGNVITRGSEQDTNGICIAGDGNAGFANMVFYKLILYPKTIPLLQINFLKNLMERDEIIDLNNPIFIKNE